MDASTMAWLRPLMWVGAIILFIIGGYSDANTTECWAWAFALLTGRDARDASARHGRQIGLIGLRSLRSGMGPLSDGETFPVDLLLRKR